jgi:hypothetical protein
MRLLWAHSRASLQFANPLDDPFASEVFKPRRYLHELAADDRCVFVAAHDHLASYERWRIWSLNAATGEIRAGGDLNIRALVGFPAPVGGTRGHAVRLHLHCGLRGEPGGVFATVSLVTQDLTGGTAPLQERQRQWRIRFTRDLEIAWIAECDLTAQIVGSHTAINTQRIMSAVHDLGPQQLVAVSAFRFDPSLVRHAWHRVDAITGDVTHVYGDYSGHQIHGTRWLWAGRDVLTGAYLPQYWNGVRQYLAGEAIPGLSADEDLGDYLLEGEGYYGGKVSGVFAPRSFGGPVAARAGSQMIALVRTSSDDFLGGGARALASWAASTGLLAHRIMGWQYAPNTAAAPPSSMVASARQPVASLPTVTYVPAPAFRSLRAVLETSENTAGIRMLPYHFGALTATQQTALRVGQTERWHWILDSGGHAVRVAPTTGFGTPAPTSIDARRALLFAGGLSTTTMPNAGRTMLGPIERVATTANRVVILHGAVPDATNIIPVPEWVPGFADLPVVDRAYDS